MTITSWQAEAGALYVPLLSLIVLWRFLRPQKQTRIAMAHMATWQLATLPLLNYLALQRSWWSFETTGPNLFGIPFSLLIGWIIMWGPLTTLIMAHLPSKYPIFWTTLALILFDLITMPFLSSILSLKQGWLIGETITLAIALIPATALGHFTLLNQRPETRATLVSIATATIIIGILPFSLSADIQIPWGWQLGLLLLTGSPAIAAVIEFARSGNGTPIPYDPPQKLVVTGPYAYMRNPIQVGMVLSLVILGLLLQTSLPFIIAVIAIIYSEGIARWSENTDLEKRYGDRWLSYRSSQQNWIPRLLPHTPSGTIYFDSQCGTCSKIENWFRKQHPVKLNILPAKKNHRRVTYSYHDNTKAEGVAAIACALQHLHLGWAYLGWIIQIPGIKFLSQQAIDQVFPPKKLNAAA